MILDIITIIISFLSLVISFVFTIWNTRPHVRIKVESGTYTKQLNFLAVSVSISNSSQISGTISDAYVKIGKQKYPCIYVGENYDLSNIKLQTTINKNFVFIEDNQLRVPFSIKPFSFSWGGFIFPNVSSDKPIESFRFYTKHVGRLRPVSHFVCATSSEYNR